MISTEQLIQDSLDRKEGTLTASGALAVLTGERTGRSPADRFIVEEPGSSGNIDWNKLNKKISESVFDALLTKVEAYLEQNHYYESDLHVGADDQYSIPIKAKTQLAWHTLFARNIFVVPEQFNPKQLPEWTVVNAPNFKCDPKVDGTNSESCVMINFKRRTVLIAGMFYAGEMKKAMFSVQNYLLPEHDVLPMHCSASYFEESDRVTLFFGLSGTGKTTLSADDQALIIGDDEHAWASGKVFNLEGGCYAKCINLSQENEPVIWNSIKKGSVIENVVVDEKGVPDYSDSSITENSRCCYPRTHIDNRVDSNTGAEPKSVVFLTCDVRGILPAVSALTPDQAAYHFLSGYTALVGSTEMGASAGMKSTFSHCFGAPFFPRHPQVYADLLIDKVNKNNVKVFLVNTGWVGGPYGVGSRFAIPVTRQIVRAIMRGELDNVEVAQLEYLNLQVPTKVPGVDSALLNPRQTWKDKDAYDKLCGELLDEFDKNIQKFTLSEQILKAGLR